MYNHRRCGGNALKHTCLFVCGKKCVGGCTQGVHGNILLSWDDPIQLKVAPCCSLGEHVFLVNLITYLQIKKEAIKA